MAKNEIVGIIDDLSVWAERYAINRSSYANQSTCYTLRVSVSLGYLSQKTMETLVRDITKAIDDKIIPYEDQIRDWEKLKNELNRHISPEEYM